MNSIILCEGKTDAILTSYYLDRVCGWEFLGGKKPIDIKVRNVQSEELNWYKLNDKKLCIWGVGGVSNFEYAINYIMDLNKVANEEQVFNKIIIIIDRDDEENNQNIINIYNNIFKNNNVNINLELNRYKESIYENDIEDEVNIEVGMIVLPLETKGAIETFLLEAIREQKDEKYIVDKSREFVATIENSKYLKKRRDKVKAELGVTFALISPDKVFTPLHLLLSQIKWEKYSVYNEALEILKNL